MLSISECRKILGPACTLSDSELELLRDQLHAFASVVFSVYQENPHQRSLTSQTALNADDLKVLKGSQNCANFEEMLLLLSPDEQEAAIERVSILEADARIDRKNAENALFLEFVNRHHGIN